MNVRRGLVVTIATGLALALGGAGAAAQAAAPADNSCPQGSLCVWEGANYTGTKHVDPLQGDCDSFAAPVRSAKNYTDRLASFWIGESCIDSGSVNDIVFPGEEAPSFWFGAAWSVGSYAG
ncbi:peptidase inhibitor family I36 protein [Flindersiella endophytica]